MDRIEKQSFVIARSFVGLSYFGVFLFGAFAIGSVGIAVIEYIDYPENKGAIVLYLLMTLIFLGFAYAAFRVIREIKRAPVTVDEDGIWRTYLGKAQGLIAWSEVNSIKEKQYGQRLELHSESGKTLIKLEYQLEGFEDLRHIVVSKTRRPETKFECPAIFKKPARYHVLATMFNIAVVVLSYFAGKNNLALGLLLFVVVVVLGSLGYLTTVSEIKLNHRTLKIRYPLRSRTFDRMEVASIDLVDRIVKQARHPEVTITTTSGDKPIRLAELGPDASSLYDVLDRWRNEQLFRN